MTRLIQFELYIIFVLQIVVCLRANSNFTVHLVVAQFQEDISWLREVKRIEKDSIFVYQKHNPSGERYLKNTGNECHAYVRHIVDNYNKLADYTIFVQGKPNDHCPNILDYINHAPICESKADFEAGKPRPLVFMSNLQQNHSSEILTKYIPDVYKYHLLWVGTPVADTGTSIWSNGMFQAARERIQLHPLSFWDNVLVELTSSSPEHGERHGVYVCGYLEQMWHELLGNPPLTSSINIAYVNGEESQICGPLRHLPLLTVMHKYIL